MKKKNISKLWFFFAICFMIAGVIGKNMVDIVFVCVCICIGCSELKQKNKQ